MTRRILSILVLATVAAPSVHAQGSERYLPAGSQILVQIDPAAKHKAAFDKTVAGQIWSGEVGKCLLALYRHALQGGELLAQQNRVAAEDIELAKAGLKIAESLIGQGVSLGIELASAN